MVTGDKDQWAVTNTFTELSFQFKIVKPCVIIKINSKTIPVDFIQGLTVVTSCESAH